MNKRCKSHHSLTIWSGLLVLILTPALACNLPARQAEGLTFPTDQPLRTSSGLPFPTSETDQNPSVVIASPYPATSLEAGQMTTPFWGLQTATPGQSVPGAWSTPAPGDSLPPFTYWTQPGDTLNSVAARFNISPELVSPPQPPEGLLTAGLELIIPDLLGNPPYNSAALPDNAVIYSPAVANFQIDSFIRQAGGYLSSYREKVDPEEWLTGAEIVQRVALEASINPQLLLAFLEFRSGWVYGQPIDPAQVDYPIGFYVPDYSGLYLELSLVAKELNIGYYGWRQGTLTDLTFPDYTHMRIAPALNAGSVALQLLLSKFYRHQREWLDAIYGTQGLMNLYDRMFGDPWLDPANSQPLFPADLKQPTLELPFAAGELWSLTSGPHISWRTGTPRGALDFAPITGEPPCVVSTAWVTASAPGRVVRAERGMVVLDLDGDGLEQTGWVLVYMHIAEEGRVSAGSWVDADTPIGHPSCEGGQATGTHVHLARKYNGEWLAADGPLPMVLSGWVAHAGKLSYEGTLEKDGQVVSARPDGSAGSTIIR